MAVMRHHRKPAAARAWQSSERGNTINFLAHSLLDVGDDAVLVGQFAGDFARGASLAHWPERNALGIRLHRHVDAFTDTHPDVAALRAAFRPELRRYAGISLDIAFDQALAVGWDTYGAAVTRRTLPAHAAHVDGVLQRAADTAQRSGSPWPDGLEGLRRALHERRLFEFWGTDEGVRQTLLRLAQRRPRLAALSECGPEIARLKPRIADVCAVLMPALAASVATRLATLSANHDRHRTVTSGR